MRSLILALGFIAASIQFLAAAEHPATQARPAIAATKPRTEDFRLRFGVSEADLPSFAAAVEVRAGSGGSPAAPGTEPGHAEDQTLNSDSPEPQASGFVRPHDFPRSSFDWQAAGTQSFLFLGMEHGMRMIQTKTRRELGGPFFHDYLDAVSGLGGWGDGDSILTNYVGHPMQGSITGFIQIQNDPHGAMEEFNSGGAYWRSRLKAMAWAAVYSTQFELGPVSEASLGNVGRKRGTMGFVDLVMTPTGGFGLIVAEDAADRYWIKPMEAGRSDGMKRFLRMALNPQRSFANLLRFKKPWYRDTRSMAWDQ